MGRPPGAKNKPKPPPALEPKERRSRVIPVYEPTDIERVKMMVSTGSDIRVMAELMGIGVEEFRRTYRKEMTTGHDYVYAVISTKLLQAALGGHIPAQLSWMRQFGGWMETSRKEITGKDGQPISIQSLDGASLVALLQAIGEKGSSRRSRSRTSPPQIDYEGDPGDLDAIPGPTDESAEE